jgi:hypothetical protein
LIGDRSRTEKGITSINSFQIISRQDIAGTR